MDSIQYREGPDRGSEEGKNLIEIEGIEDKAVLKVKENYPKIVHDSNIPMEERMARIRKQKTMIREHNED